MFIEFNNGQEQFIINTDAITQIIINPHGGNDIEATIFFMNDSKRIPIIGERKVNELKALLKVGSYTVIEG